MNNLQDSRLNDIIRFYDILDSLHSRVGEYKQLKDCNSKTDLPKHGVYFFFEDGETRTCSGTGLRVVRVGTHALTEASKSTLWNRLQQHRGNAETGLGHHRGSIFRLRVGAALARQTGCCLPNSWGKPVGNREEEAYLERCVTNYISEMPFLCLPVPDRLDRACIEGNAIALLSDYKRDDIDPPSGKWLGKYSDRQEIYQSGLWNSQHINERYVPSFLKKMECLVKAMD